MEVEAGNENMMFETGPFSFYGVMALSAPTLGETDEHTHITHTSHTHRHSCVFMYQETSEHILHSPEGRASSRWSVCVCVILNTLLQGWRTH